MSSFNPYAPPRAELSAGRPIWVPERLSGAGGVFARGCWLYAHNFRALVVLTLAIYAPVELAKNLFVYQVGVESSVVTRLDMIIGALVGACLAPALIYTVVEPYRRGAAVGLGAALRYGVDRWAETFRANFLAGLWMFGGLLLLVVPGLVVLVWYAFTDEVVALEQPTASGALSRSKLLTTGHRWVVFFAFLLAGVVYGAIAFAAGLAVALVDNWVVATAIDLLLDVSYPVISLVGLALYVSLAYGESGDSSWVERVRWARAAPAAAQGAADSAVGV